MPTFRNVNTGQVVTVEADPSHLSGLARWERIEEGPSAPAQTGFTQEEFEQAQAELARSEAAVAQAQAEEAAAQAELDQAAAELTQARDDAEDFLTEAAAELSPPAQEFINPTPAPAPERPADNADRKEWLAYAKAMGRTDADLKGVKTVEIRDWFAE